MTGSQEVYAETKLLLDNLTSEWHRWAQADEGLIYSTFGTTGRRKGNPRTPEPAVLIKPMEQTAGRGFWPVATSLREVEEEADVILLQERED